MTNSLRVTVSWPKDKIPIEMFTMISTYLPRSSIQNMRLVNKEFEEKVSDYLFRVVVVPFRPEIYGINPAASLAGAAAFGPKEELQDSMLLLDKGMRVFQGFGGRISKFAMSFEFDENKLANPPIKCDQEAITSFWGSYRWPFKKYNRYSQLEGLEQTADETSTMAKALKYIKCAKELGLSIDGGLGWLSGPDINPRVAARGDKVVVFGGSRFVAEPKSTLDMERPLFRRNNSHSSSADGGPACATAERILVEAGSHGESLQPSVQMPLQSEESIQHLPRTRTIPTRRGGGPGLGDPRHGAFRPSLSMESHVTAVASADDASPLEYYYTREEEHSAETAITSNIGKAKSESYPLKPNRLSSAQREMLLETEWAQRAFMQSYVIAIIDNPQTFEHIEALTIARLPNRHLPILRREDFWESLPQLRKVSLAIIPDWREVSKLPTSWVEDTALPPSKSLPGVYRILKDQVARRPNIKDLHFEWLCGGEEAPGIFARNQHILSAPVLPDALGMVTRLEQPALLSLPHIENLSLKNCWFSPHILLRFGSSFKSTALQSLTLNSVSLTAPVFPRVPPNLLIGAAVHPQNVTLQVMNYLAAVNQHLNLQAVAGQNAQVAPVPPLVLPVTAPDTDPFEPPRDGSWASIVDALTPGDTLAQQRHRRDTNGLEPPADDTGRFTKLEFKSCGYVRLPLALDQTVLDPPEGPAPRAHALTIQMRDLDRYMMHPIDIALGVIVNYIDPNESRTLESGFLLRVGWDDLDPSQALLTSDAKVDGITFPGKGRFSGIIERARMA